MKKQLYPLCLLLMLVFALPVHSQGKIKSTRQLIKAMKKRYQGKWFNAFTFVQKTIRYNKEGQPGNAVLWYEAIRYPNNFRIDFGHPSEGNTVIFNADTAYRFKNNKFSGSKYDPQYFLLLKGGLYHRKLKQCMNILKKGGYQTDLFHQDTYKGRPVYVIGGDKGDLSKPQFWIDQQHFYIIRRTQKISRGRILDVQYQKHKATGGGWVEQVVRFEVDGRLVQIEEYTEIDTSPSIPANLFDYTQYGKEHWFKGAKKK